MATEDECLEALQRAAKQLGESPTKAQYEELGLTPASATIMKTMGGWNAAKERADLETFDPQVTGGQPIQPKPDWVDIPDDTDWKELTGQQRWYYKNRGERICRKDRRRNRLRKRLRTYKDEQCECRRCDEDRPPCLDFHHPGQKESNISKMVNNGYSWNSIREEIDHCIVLCANCHRLEHHDSVVDHLSS
ncbi:homing endonuclease associated repeat-containing protein [Natrinema salinisoli]|uniref:homing endonuclease associated repeat-containing protein n=1 Tax=Natrinema salinisoli TaxID=2878535 RepID=UPI001CF095C0|nr:HNH endonuclease [Natrinema salinisoli]